jgi:trehalose 6-phosphate synthase/phosphatase
MPEQDVVEIDDREFGVARGGMSANPSFLNLGDAAGRVLTELERRNSVERIGSNARRTSLTGINEPPAEELKLREETPVIVASYRLPIVATPSTTGSSGRKWEITWDEHQVKLVSRMQALVPKVRMRWVGWPGVFIPAEERPQIDADLASLNCTAVWLERDSVERFHGVLCEKILWPIFHDINELPIELMNFDPMLWQEYKSVNEKFRDVILDVLASLRPLPTKVSSGDDLVGQPHGDVAKHDLLRPQPVKSSSGDDLVGRAPPARIEQEQRVVWIFDYELMLLPSLLMTKAPDVARAWFSTLPFPSSDVFRLLPMRTELLCGVLCSQLIGFLMFDYTRHFLYCCTRLLGLQHHSKRGGMLCVKYNERFVLLRSSHVGVNPKGIQDALEASETCPDLQKWMALIRRRQVVVGYDELHPMKGIHLKLLAFERLLQICPQYQSNLLLLQVIVNKHECGGAATAPVWYEAEVRGLAKRINDAHPDSVILVDAEMTRANRMAFLSLGDVFLSTPVRLGLYLVAYEYVLCSQKKQGVVVLSEFIGCAKILNEVLRVNPWNIEEMALVISRALSMEPAQRARAHRQNLAFVQKSTLFKWADSFLQDAIRAGAAGHTKANDVIYAGLANGTIFRAVGSSEHLKAEPLHEAYRRATTRVLIFNYEALEDQKDSKDLFTILGALSRDPRNSVLIMTDNAPNKLDLWRQKLGMAYDPHRLIGVSAEQGCYYQWHGSSTWECISKDLDLTWKSVRLGPPPHRRRDWAHPAHICAGTGP